MVRCSTTGASSRWVVSIRWSLVFKRNVSLENEFQCQCNRRSSKKLISSSAACACRKVTLICCSSDAHSRQFVIARILLQDGRSFVSRFIYVPRNPLRDAPKKQWTRNWTFGYLQGQIFNHFDSYCTFDDVLF